MPITADFPSVHSVLVLLCTASELWIMSLSTRVFGGHLNQSRHASASCRDSHRISHDYAGHPLVHADRCRTWVAINIL